MAGQRNLVRPAELCGEEMLVDRVQSESEMGNGTREAGEKAKAGFVKNKHFSLAGAALARGNVVADTESGASQSSLAPHDVATFPRYRRKCLSIAKDDDIIISFLSVPPATVTSSRLLAC